MQRLRSTRPRHKSELHRCRAEFKVSETIFEILAKQFEMAKLDEAKDYPLIQILDKAITPEKKTKPKRALIVILATLVAFFLAVIWAFF